MKISESHLSRKDFATSQRNPLLRLLTLFHGLLPRSDGSLVSITFILLTFFAYPDLVPSTTTRYKSLITSCLSTSKSCPPTTNKSTGSWFDRRRSLTRHCPRHPLPRARCIHLQLYRLLQVIFQAPKPILLYQTGICRVWPRNPRVQIQISSIRKPGTCMANSWRAAMNKRRGSGLSPRVVVQAKTAL
jgi:hypothetical protein